MSEKRYRNRRERAQFAAHRYASFLGRLVLDVGGDKGYFREHISGTYICLDIAGTPDVFANLEEGHLPFLDQAFDSVVCLDVLEHLDSIHDVFLELARVSARYVIISLPNAWIAVDGLRSGRPRRLKFYGLPLERPSDRHKWFFNYTEAVTFVYGMARKSALSVLICEAYYAPRTAAGELRRLARRVMWSNDRFDNLEAMALWAVLERKK